MRFDVRKLRKIRMKGVRSAVFLPLIKKRNTAKKKKRRRVSGCAFVTQALVVAQTGNENSLVVVIRKKNVRNIFFLRIILPLDQHVSDFIKRIRCGRKLIHPSQISMIELKYARKLFSVLPTKQSGFGFVRLTLAHDE